MASISSFIIGAVWFGPKTFYPIWVKAQGREVPASEGKSSGAEMALMFGGTYVGALVQVATLAVLLELARLANPTLGAGEGAFLGLVFGIGLGADQRHGNHARTKREIIVSGSDECRSHS